MCSMNINNCHSCLRNSNYNWVWHIYIPPVPKRNQLPKAKDPKWDESAHIFFFEGGDVFGFGTEQQSCLARTTRFCPGQMNSSHEQENSIIYLRHVCTHGVSEKVAGSNGRWFAPPQQAIIFSNQSHGPCW